MNEWISIQNRLPEPEEDVLVSVNGEMCVAYKTYNFSGYEIPWIETMNRINLCTMPTHWMPLPKPPEEK